MTTLAAVIDGRPTDSMPCASFWPRAFARETGAPPPLTAADPACDGGQRGRLVGGGDLGAGREDGHAHESERRREEPEHTLVGAQRQHEKGGAHRADGPRPIGPERDRPADRTV